MWLATVISVVFFAQAAWRIAKPGSDTVGRAYAYVNAANFILLGLLGLGCLYWPRRKDEDDDDKSPAGAEQVVVVVDSTPAADGKSTSDSAKDAPTEAPTEAPPKRQVIYLSNLKTFLTFIVVTHHVVCFFSNACADGLQTYSLDMGKLLTFQDQDFRSFALPGLMFTTMNQFYFMAPFYLISAYFCPRSLDRKGFRKFVVDKLVRLGGAWLLWTMLLAPLMWLMVNAYAGQPLGWAYDQGTVWFVLWLLNFSVVYAAIAQFIPTVKMSMPHPFILLVIGMALSGVYYGISYLVIPRGALFFGNMNMWNYGIAMYIPWFIAGIVGSRNDWLKSVEEMSTWVVWTLRFIVVGFWTIIFMVFAQYTIPIPGSHLDFELVNGLLPPVYAMPMTLVVLQLFHQYFNATPQSKLMRNAGSAAYLVYVIQFWPMNLVMMTFVEILKAAGTPIIFIDGHNFITTDAEGNGTLLSEGAIWGGFFFVLVLTQLILWPLSFYLRKLPVMNKMF